MAFDPWPPRPYPISDRAFIETQKFVASAMNAFLNSTRPIERKSAQIIPFPNQRKAKD